MNKLTYKIAGVDIDKANQTIKGIKPFIHQTASSYVLSKIGYFGGFFELNFKKYKKPVLVSSIDGVGTKLKIAFMLNKHSTIGIDLVNHCANDIVVSGAKPLFFLDYLALAKMEPKVVKEIIKGISFACQKIGCSLISGETAEMPGFYHPGEYDLAGCIIGIVDKTKLITGKNIKPKDLVIGLASSGLHTNGYSLARKILFEKLKLKVTDYVSELKTTLGEELLKPHLCYSNIILELLEKYKIKGLAHITGGGFIDNIPRILPEGVKVKINKNSWQVLPIFNLLQQVGKISDFEMFRTFNMGIGIILVCQKSEGNKIIEYLTKKNVKTNIIGEIIKGKKEVEIS